MKNKLVKNQIETIKTKEILSIEELEQRIEFAEAAAAGSCSCKCKIIIGY